jgi:ribosomal protein L5
MRRKPDPTFVRNKNQQTSKIDQVMIAKLLTESSQDEKQIDQLFKDLTEITTDKIREIGQTVDVDSSPIKPFDAKKIADKTIF